jgi:hypothetical protein
LTGQSTTERVADRDPRAAQKRGYPVRVLPVAISNGEVILIVVFAAIPVAAITFAAGAGKALRQVGKGPFSVQFDSDLPQKMRDSDAEGGDAETREAEIRQLLEAKAYRQANRGERPLDVESELDRLLAEDEAKPPSGEDAELREEVRQLVVARNARRQRQGKEPLEVEAEVERQLRELENLGQ